MINKRIKWLISLVARRYRYSRITPLIKRGLIIGGNFQFEKGLLIDKIYPHLISIGNDVTFSSDIKILAHDAGLKNIMGLARIGHVKIGNRVFIGVNTIILPNVIIGDDVIIGAGSIVSKNIPSGTVCCGVPAKVVCSIEEYKAKILSISKECPIFEYSLKPLTMTNRQKQEQIKLLENSIGLKKTINYSQLNSLENNYE